MIKHPGEWHDLKERELDVLTKKEKKKTKLMTVNWNEKFHYNREFCPF